MAVLVAQATANVAGFLEVGLRSHADSWGPRGRLALWKVVPRDLRKKESASLDVARGGPQQGCREMASDTWIDDERSISAHQALGFEVADRCVHFRKSL
jgi:aminoglycoside 6'-N-acetyltransferase I